MMRAVVILALVLAALLAATPALADRRFALVIGNGVYENVARLPNPPNDANDVAASLRRLGFDVTTLIDARYDNMRRALIEFGQRSQGAEFAVIFFAGHGIQIAGENWLIPVDARLTTDLNVANEAIGLQAVTRAVSNTSKLGLVILDACRTNPFLVKMKSTNLSRAVDRGFSRVEPSENVLVAYAARDGTTASDGPARNSPFTNALLKNIETPGLEIQFLFRKIRDEVMKATRREQQPFVYGSLSNEEIYLGAAPAKPADSEQLLWDAVKESRVAGLFEEFLKRYPNSTRAAAARARIAEFSASAGTGNKPVPAATVAALPARVPDAVAEKPATGGSMRGLSLIADEVPFICDKCRSDLKAEMAKARKHTALALSLDGNRYWASGANSTNEARQWALARCLGDHRFDCIVYAVDGKIVWDEPRVALPEKPWIRRDPAREKPLDFKLISGISAFDQARLAALKEKMPKMALAVGAFGQWSMVSGGQNDEDNARMALERCAYITRSQCQVTAVNETLLAEQGSVRVTPSRASASVLPSNLRPLDVGRIPFVSDLFRERLRKTVSDQPQQHNALVISIEGGIWWSGNKGTIDEARASALGQCLATTPQMCMVYAVDAQVVWDEPQPVLPATPWFVRDAKSEKPFDVDKVLPRFPASTRQFIKDNYGPAAEPKAIAAVDIWSGAWSKIGQIASEEEAARLALERCGFILRRPCRIVAINNSAVSLPSSGR